MKIKRVTIPVESEGVTEEFMVCLGRAVKGAQADEKHCYHCSSLEHFIHNFLLVKTSREKKQLNGKEGTVSMSEGSPDPSNNNQCCEEPPHGGSQGIKPTPQTPFLNLDPFQ